MELLVQLSEALTHVAVSPDTQERIVKHSMLVLLILVKMVEPQHQMEMLVRVFAHHSIQDQLVKPSQICARTIHA